MVASSVTGTISTSVGTLMHFAGARSKFRTKKDSYSIKKKKNISRRFLAIESKKDDFRRS